MEPLKSVAEAQVEIHRRIRPRTPETAPLSECLGLVLAEEIRATGPHPPFDNSAMDGYAVMAADVPMATAAMPVRLAVIEDIRAGYAPVRAVASGMAARIMTGAVMPFGADSIVPVEDTDGGVGQVHIFRAPTAGAHVRRAGSHIPAGAVVLFPGRILGPAELGLAATVGRGALPIVPRPRVGILATGDELVEPGRPLGPGQIWNANTTTLAAQVRQWGGIPLDLGVVSDDPDALLERVGSGLAAVDLLVTSAGVSIGASDVVKPVLEALGVPLVFWRIAMKPGKPLGFGLDPAGRPVFALPGNPVSSMVTFHVFVGPAIRRMAGAPWTEHPVIHGVMGESFRKARGLTHYVRVRLERREGRPVAFLTGVQDSHVLASMAAADALLVVPDEVEAVEAGEAVTLLELRAMPREWGAWR